MNLLSKLRTRHWLGITVLVGVLLRVWQLSATPLWYDETGTLWMSSLPFGQMLTATAADVHPPLYLALTWLTTRLLGANVFALRLPSLIFGVSAAPLITLIARQLNFSRPTIVGALWLFALAPFQIYYAQEARMYALLQLEVLAMIYFILKRQYPLAAAAFAAQLWTHNYAFIYGAAIYVLALALQPKDYKKIIVWASVGGATYLVWLGALYFQLTAQRESWWQQPTSVGTVAQTLYTFFARDSFKLLPELEPLAMVVIFTALAYAVVKSVLGKQRGTLVAAYLAFAPMLIAWGIEYIYRPVFLTRALIACAPFVYLLLAHAFTNVPLARRLTAWGVVGSLMLTAAVCYAPTIALTKSIDTNTLKYIDYQQGDLVYHLNAGTAFEFYANGKWDAAVNYVHPPFPRDLGALSVGTMQALNVPLANFDDLPKGRVWLVWSASPTVSADQDTYVKQILLTYPNQPRAEFSAAFIDPRLVGGGVWLVTKQ